MPHPLRHFNKPARLNRPGRAIQYLLYALLISAHGGALLADQPVSEVEVEVEDDYLTEEDVFTHIPVITGASHFPQKISNSPTSISIIDRAMIEASGALEVVDLLRLVPGFQAYFGSAGYGTANYHALPQQFANRLEVKVDGRSVYESLFNIVVWQTLGIELEDIDHIEVVRGSNTPSDGANAFNGSINIITKSPASTQGLSGRVEAGDLNTRNYSLVYSNSAEQLSYRLTLQDRSNDGFPTFQDEAVEDQSDTQHIGLRSIWTPNPLDTVEFSLGFSDTELGMTEGSGDEPDSVLRWSFDYNYQYLNWEHRLANNDSFKVLAYHNDLTINVGRSLGLFSEAFGVAPGVLIPGVEDFVVDIRIEDGRSERYELEGRYNGSIGAALRYSAGVAARFDEADSELFFTTSDSFTEEFYRAYINTEIDISSALVLNAGYLIEHTTTVGDVDSYRVSSNYHFNDNNTVRLAFNRAASAPTLLLVNEYRTIHSGENIFDVDRIPFPGLKEEELETVEIGYYGRFLKQRLTLDLKAFVEKYDDIIKDRTHGDYPQDFDNKINYRDNVVWMDVDGYEAQLDFRLTPACLIGLQYTHLNITGEHLRKTAPVRITNLEQRNSEQILNLLIAYDFSNHYSASVNYYRQTEVNYDGGAFVDDYDRLDLRLAKKFFIGKSDGKLELIAHNVLDESYLSFREFNQFERRIYGRAVINF